MGKLTGLLKIEGRVGELICYKCRGEHLVRSYSGISASRIAKDKAFERTRENNAEFKGVSAACTLLRGVQGQLTGPGSTGLSIPRVTKKLYEVIRLDGISVRGRRTVGRGIVLPEGKALLNGFNFNKTTALSALLHKSYTANATTGKMEIKNLHPAKDIDYPDGCTHIRFKGVFANVDFVGLISATALTNEVTVPVNSAVTDIVLEPAALPPMADGVNMVLLGMEFVQVVNGIEYRMKNGLYNVAEIVQVA